MSLSVIEAQLKEFLDKASNGEQISIPDEAFVEFGKQMEAAARKQFTPRDQSFSIRPSNLGRSLCILQKQKSGSKAERKRPSFIVQMLIGDSVEAIVRLLLTAVGADVTSDGDKVELKVAGQKITGESDIDIGGKVYDIKSTSPAQFEHKWSKGYQALKESDDFGYVGQLYCYADAQKKDPGGWIVVNKSTGEILVVEAEDNKKEVSEIRKDREEKVKALINGAPFRRGYEAEDEYFRKKRTGDQVLSKACSWCDFKKECWPTATYRPSKMSNPEAKKPTYKWFTD